MGVGQALKYYLLILYARSLLCRLRIKKIRLSVRKKDP
jgi:hypothetical protein